MCNIHCIYSVAFNIWLWWHRPIILQSAAGERFDAKRVEVGGEKVCEVLVGGLGTSLGAAVWYGMVDVCTILWYGVCMHNGIVWYAQWYGWCMHNGRKTSDVSLFLPAASSQGSGMEEEAKPSLRTCEAKQPERPSTPDLLKILRGKQNIKTNNQCQTNYMQK